MGTFMEYFNAFWVGGLICALCQILLDLSLIHIFLGRAVGTTAREGAAAHLHALFSGHDAGADRRKTGDFAGAGVLQSVRA